MEARYSVQVTEPQMRTVVLHSGVSKETGVLFCADDSPTRILDESLISCLRCSFGVIGAHVVQHRPERRPVSRTEMPRGYVHPASVADSASLRDGLLGLGRIGGHRILDVTPQMLLASSVMMGLFENSGLGLERGHVQIVASDPRWPLAFARLAALLRSMLPTSVIAIEHVGSTAVPGLPAKPILDVALGVGADADTGPIDEALMSNGFLYRGDFEGGSLNRTFGWEDRPGCRVVNAHVVRHGSAEWRNYLRFRDQLRENDAVRDSYAQLKRDLADRFSEDRPSYVAGKDRFVANIVGDQ